MADYEKQRQKREKEAARKLEIERQERRVIEEKQRQQARKDVEKRLWTELGMRKQQEKHTQDISDAADRTTKLVKALDDKKRKETQEQSS